MPAIERRPIANTGALGHEALEARRHCVVPPAFDIGLRKPAKGAGGQGDRMQIGFERLGHQAALRLRHQIGSAIIVEAGLDPLLLQGGGHAVGRALQAVAHDAAAGMGEIAAGLAVFGNISGNIDQPVNALRPLGGQLRRINAAQRMRAENDGFRSTVQGSGEHLHAGREGCLRVPAMALAHARQVGRQNAVSRSGQPLGHASPAPAAVKGAMHKKIGRHGRCLASALRSAAHAPIAPRAKRTISWFMPAPHPETWLRVLPQGLYCEPGDFFIDPLRAVSHAVISHGHSDHARPGHGSVLATPQTLAIMRARLGEGGAGERQQPLGYGQPITHRGVTITLVPAGHVLGSAQIVLDWQGSRAVVSGDYKRQPDPTCAAFEPVRADVFVTEATFGLPVFRHPDPAHEIAKLLDSVALFPERTHIVGAYALGKAQRVIALLRAAGWERPVYIHGALASLSALYAAEGVDLGPLRPATGARREELAGAIVVAPPAAAADRWSRRMNDPLIARASGWMRVRQRAKMAGVELPLVISDHADWDDLLRTIAETGAPEVWVTHGSEEALIHALALRQIRGRALSLIGYEEEGEAEPELAAVVAAETETEAGAGA